MNDRSPSVAVRRLEGDMRSILRNVNMRSLDLRERDALAKLSQALEDARVYTQGYELSETREEQVKNARIGKKWLRQARQHILKVSERGVFGAIDVAHLSAQIDQVIGDLK